MAGSNVREPAEDEIVRVAGRDVRWGELCASDRRVLMRNWDRAAEREAGGFATANPSSAPSCATDVKFDAKSLRMSSGLSMREDLFCVYYIETGDEIDAYCRAFEVKSREGITGSLVEGALFRNPSVIHRIEMLYNERVRLLQANAVCSVESLIRELEVAREDAMRKGAISAAVSAITAKAKLAGLLVDKSEVTVRHPSEMSDEDLKKVLEMAPSEYRKLN